MAINNFILLKIITHSFVELRNALSSTDDFNRLMLRIGWNFNSIPDPINNLFSNLESLLTDFEQISDGNYTENKLNSTIQKAKTIIESLDMLKEEVNYFQTYYSEYESEGFLTSISNDLVGYLICNTLKNEYPSIYLTLKTLGIIKEELLIHESTIRVSFTRYNISLIKISQIIFAPKTYFEENFYWGENYFQFNRLFQDLTHLLLLINVPIEKFYISESLYAKIQDGITPPVNTDTIGYAIPILNRYNESLNTNLSINLNILHLSGDENKKSGIGIIPIISGSNDLFFTQDFTNMTLSVKSSISFDSGFGITIRPNGIEIIDNLFNSTVSNSVQGDFNIALTQKPKAEEEEIYILGDEYSSHIRLSSVVFSIGANHKAGVLDYFIELKLNDIDIHIEQPSDNFLKSFIPENGLDITFSTLIGFSYSKGLYFGAQGAGLEYNVPLSKSFNLGLIKVDLKDAYIRLKSNNNNQIDLEVRSSITIALKEFLTISIINLGVKASIELDSENGNFGPFDSSFKFSPPTGIGIKIDSPKISGSGFLKIDTANKRYSGSIQLKFGKVTFTAVGILRTELPGGKEGYSLILVITAENFKPIALGYGFNLIGVGGLIGLNRSVNIDVLRAGLKTGNNDKILFPVNVIENADSIISALDSSFPEKEGRFIFGPLAKINWGTGEESILTIDLGLIIEVPKPVTVALIGVLKAIFPPNKDNSEENAKLIIKVNFLGVFDAEKKMISFDASIYDSKIASFTISGDMAFRLSYGENPGFLLSVGGFHPAYTPPPMDLPNLKRLSISLVDEKKSKVFLETYFAVTSNTVQFGARVIASAENGLYNFAAVLWFDALFQFKPFYFIVNLGGMIAIKSGGKTILTAGLDFTLQGPTPWKIDGKVYFEICKIKKSIKINKEFGKKLPEQNVDVLIEEILTAAIENADNWQIINPRYSDFVTIKGSDEKAIFLHPTGSISMNQSSVPLNLTFVKFGNSKPKDFSKFYLDNFKIGNEEIEETKLKNGFAPSMYRVMTNEQKLSAPSFEEYESGFIVGTDKISGDFFTKREVGHNKEIIDKAGKVKGLYAVEVDTIHNAMLDTYAQTFGGVSGSQNNRPYDSPASVGVETEKYIVTSRDTGTPYNSQTFDSFTDALDFSNSILNTNPAMKGKIKVVSTTQLN